MPIKVREGGAWVQVSDGVDGANGTDGVDGTGKVLQLKSSTSTTMVQNNTNNKNYYILNNNITFNAVGTNSQFFVIGYAHVYSTPQSTLARHNIGFNVSYGLNGSSVPSGGTVQARIAGVDGTMGDTWGCDAGGSGQTGTTLNRSALWVPSSGLIPANTWLQFQLLGGRWDTNLISNWNWRDPTLGSYNHNNIITVMEIAA